MLIGIFNARTPSFCYYVWFRLGNPASESCEMRGRLSPLAKMKIPTVAPSIGWRPACGVRHE